MKPVAPVRAMRGLLAAPTGFTAALRHPKRLRCSRQYIALGSAAIVRLAAPRSDGRRIAVRICSGAERSLQSFVITEVPMLDGVMLLWFLLTAASLLFVAVDIRHAGISGAQMGVRAAHGVYRRVRRVSLR